MKRQTNGKADKRKGRQTERQTNGKQYFLSLSPDSSLTVDFILDLFQLRDDVQDMGDRGGDPQYSTPQFPVKLKTALNDPLVGHVSKKPF
ncbi:hypothetical protein Btru_057362 [Bulinus truncatus]|nr:hypothetical protein Btru_057362 [Bulinus truncatus]